MSEASQHASAQDASSGAMGNDGRDDQGDHHHQQQQHSWWGQSSSAYQYTGPGMLGAIPAGQLAQAGGQARGEDRARRVGV